MNHIVTMKAKIILDSVSDAGARITTFELTYPRFIHSEIMTHRDRARNAASSRAIPWSKMKTAITENPVVPLVWGMERKGMQTGDALDVETADKAEQLWLHARDAAVHYADELHKLGVHKSLCNRLTEPFMWITVIMTATEWKNLFRLRCHPDAEIHFQTIANLTKEVLEASTPVPRHYHLPYIQEDEYILPPETLKKISTARCARVSYLTHEGKRDVHKDIDLFNRLAEGSGFGHWSPMEHPCTAMKYAHERSGPFVGWQQYRKEFSNECADH